MKSPRFVLMCVIATGCFSHAASPPAESAPPLVYFPGDGNLDYTDAAGTKGEARLEGNSPEAIKYLDGFIAGKSTRGIYLPSTAVLSVPVHNLNPEEGTLSYWFRPDWSPLDRRSSLIVELDAPPIGRLSFRKGYPHVPDQCYLDFNAAGGTGDGGSSSFAPHHLFTGREWRHYAIRWSVKRGQIQFVVDGDSSFWRAGKYKMETPGPIDGHVLLNGDACGAFAEVKVFDHYLEIDELAKVAGLTHIATSLQGERLPDGAVPVGSPLTFVNPVTGEKVAVAPPSTDEKGHALTAAYNPDAVKDLPITLHTPWARPLAGKPLRVLFVMPASLNDGMHSLVREGIELWERLEMKCEIIDRFEPAIMNQDYDVIVVSHQGIVDGRWGGWSDLETALRKWILERVSSGRCGLVLCFPTKTDKALMGLFDPKMRVASDAVLRGFPTTSMDRANLLVYDKIYDLDDGFFEDPQELSSLVELYQGDKIRAVKLDYSLSGGWPSHVGLTPDTAQNSGATLAHYDYWMALAARAVLFAAGREPKIKIANADVEGEKWTVRIDNPEKDSVLEYRARDVWDWTFLKGKVSPNQVTLSIDGVKLPPRAVVDFILRDSNGRVLDWYSAAVPPARKTRISNLTLSQDHYERNEPIDGHIEIVADGKNKRRIEVYLTDEVGRRLDRRIFDAGEASSASFSFGAQPGANSLLMRVEALLFENGVLVDRRNADCPLPDSSFNDFYFAMYGAGMNRAVDVLRRELFRDRYGINTSWHSGNFAHGELARENLQHIEYLTHLGYPRDEKSIGGWMEDWSKFFPEHLRADPKLVERFRPLFYSLGEEHYMLSQGTANPKVNALFREEMQKKYGGDLSLLNKTWGAHFSSWADVRTVTFEPLDMMTIKFDSGRFETRRFMEKLFADKHAYLANCIRQIDPLAQVGIHAGWDLWMGRGYDYWLLSRAIDSMMGYDVSQGFSQNAYIRSFFTHYYGAINHYYIGSQEDVKWHPWEMLINGAHGFGWYTLDIEPFGATFADFRLTGDWEAAAPEYQAAAKAGNLLVHTTYDQDQVAIHYSQDSFQAGVGSAISWIHLSFINLFYDGGVPFRFLSYDQIAQGALSQTKPLLFVLPHSISLSPEETAAIRDYVSQGGVVWADVIPGTYDRFGQKLDQSQLADLFSNLKQVQVSGGGTVGVGAFGGGTVILGDIGNYSYARNVGDYLKDQGILAEVKEISRVKSVATVTNVADGKPANGVWLAGYHHGRQRYIVLAKDYQLVDQSKVDVLVDPGQRGHVYDLRAGRYLGELDKIPVHLEPTVGEVFSILPYRVRQLTATLSVEPVRGQSAVISVDLVSDQPMTSGDSHFLSVSETDPDGRELPALRHLVEIKGGHGLIQLPVAYNDKPGRWNISIKDVTTGFTAKAGFSLN